MGLMCDASECPDPLDAPKHRQRWLTRYSAVSRAAPSEDSDCAAVLRQPLSTKSVTALAARISATPTLT